jgi:hypothetical protein
MHVVLISWFEQPDPEGITFTEQKISGRVKVPVHHCIILTIENKKKCELDTGTSLYPTFTFSVSINF